MGTAQAVAGGPADPYPYPGYSITVIGGGASFPSVVYRELLDCYFHPMGYDNTTGPGPMPGTASSAPGIPAGQTINQHCPSFPYGTSTNAALDYYYVPTGSGNGKTAIKANDNTKLSTSFSTSIPYTSANIKTYPYPKWAGYHFSGSDDVWNLKDQKDWETAGNPAKFGNLIQLPALAGAVTIILNGKDFAGSNLAQNGNAVAGTTFRINLTRQAVCGIFSGHITKWDNAILTASNNGTAMGTGQITVVHRYDGSGTNFLLTNALQEQCHAVTGPNNESDSTVVSYAFPWTEYATSGSPATQVCPSLPRGANQVTWPDQFATSCGVSNPTPSGAVFTNSGSNGSQSQVNKVMSTPGAIGYVSPDFAQPANTSGPMTANLQNEWDVSTNATGIPTFVAPTVAATVSAMGSSYPVFPTTASLSNPLAWSLQGTVPNPTQAAAYPIAGFTWLEMYQCYASGDNIPQQLREFLYVLYAGGNSEQILNDNGFAKVPQVWMDNAIWPLLSNDTISIQNTWDSSKPSCYGKTGAL